MTAPAGSGEAIARLTSALDGRYRVERELGAGGMATVYLSTDVRHDRQVALKVLRGASGETVDASRFHREIKVLARLRHPFILPLHDSGEADGKLFYVMPYIEGDSLRGKLRREDRLAVKDAITIARQVADALHTAHAEGIVHRDVKPENILLTRSGHALLADFGIARTEPAAGATSMTEAGLTLGTVAYMSPEQATASPDIDARSDVYALGCVVFEMLAGRPPFTGNAIAVIGQHLTAPVPDVRTTRHEVSESVARALMRALAKAPSARFESAMAFADALADDLTSGERAAPVITMAAEVASRLSLAVLPVATIGGGDENAWFAEGITEELTGALSRLEGLRVVSRTSVQALRGQSLALAAMGARLGVEFVLEGSVRRAGERLRMTVTLARVSDDTPLWTETFDRSVQDVFAVQDEITSRTVETIAQSLQLGGLRGQQPVPAPRSLEAYDLYLLGRHHWYQRNEASMLKARELFEQAIALDPNYAAAHAGLADACALLTTWRFKDHANLIPAALAAAHKALELDPNSSEAHASVGFVKLNWEWDWLGAAQAFRRAIALNPNNEVAHRWFSAFLGGLGRTDEALPIAERARLLDPVSPLPVMNLGNINLLGWRFEEAERWFRAITPEQPVYERTKIWIAMTYFGNDRHEDALPFAREAYTAMNGAPISAFILGIVATLAGRAEEGHPLLRALLGTSFPMWYQGMARGFLGDEDGMFADLERALVERSDWFYSLPRHPWLRRWHGDPRFQAVVEKLGLPGREVPLA